MRRLLILTLCALAAAAAGASGATAAALPAGELSRPLTLDAYSPGLLPQTPAVSVRRRLTDKALYVATVQGSISYYAAVDYLAPQFPFDAVCGTPGPAPQFGSAGGVGKVSNDAQFILAIPSTTTCAGVVVPRPWLGFQIKDDGYWTHPAVLSPRPLTRPTRTHAYEFGLMGHGLPIGFRLSDPDTRDDYGSLHITVRQALPSECRGAEYKSYGLPSRSACLKRTAHDAGTRPPAPVAVRPLSLDQEPIAGVVRDSDIPSAVNQELPSGALTAVRFADLDTPTGTTARSLARSLTADHLVSAAISEFTDAGAPSLTSTATLFASAGGALAGYRAEISEAGELAPAGTRTTTAAQGPPAPANTERATFTPTVAGSAGGVELISLVGREVYALRAVQAPDLVDPAIEQALLAAVIAHS